MAKGQNWNKILNEISSNPDEKEVEIRFILPLIKDLGYHGSEYSPQFATGWGSCKVDFAARSNAGRKDEFFESKKDPFLFIEVKKPAEDIRKQEHKRQLMNYFPHPNAQTVQFGILTDSVHIQLFRRHGRVVHQLTKALPLREGNADETMSKIKELIRKPKKALTICVYNNKGGVGKTTTAVNLSATLALIGKKRFGVSDSNPDGFLNNFKKKVLAVDFDSQRDLTNSLFIKKDKGLKKSVLAYETGNFLLKEKTVLTQCLEENKSLREAMYPYLYKYAHAGKIVQVPLFDVIPANEEFGCYLDSEYKDKIPPVSKLRELLAEFTDEYDYIVIDCPTQLSFYSRSGLYAADVLLIPAKHSDLRSLHNAAKVITKIIPEINGKREDELTALPVFYSNEEKDIRIDEKFQGPEKEMFKHEVDLIIKSHDKDYDLEWYFKPNLKTDKTIVIPTSATISGKSFERKPATYKSTKVLSYYADLVKQYFLNPADKPEAVPVQPDPVKSVGIDADKVKNFRAKIYKDGKVDRKNAEALFKLNKKVSGAANDPSWKELFIEALTDHFLKDETSPGVVDEDEAAYIIGKISPDKGIDDIELSMLVNISANAKSCHESFNAFILEVLRAKILEDGIIDDSEVEMILKVISSPGSKTSKGIDKSEADFLFDLNDSTSAAENSPKWKTLFVKAVSAHLLKSKASKIDEKKAEWLIERIGQEGNLDENEKALLLHIKSSAKEIHSKLKFFMDFSKI